jgi:hypothetical protein
LYAEDNLITTKSTKSKYPAKKIIKFLLLAKKILERLRLVLISLGTKKINSIALLARILSSNLMFKKIIFTDITKVSMYIKRTIIPPVNNKTTAYIIHEDKTFLRINPKKKVKMTSHIISSLGLEVIRIEIRASLINIKKIDSKIV